MANQITYERYTELLSKRIYRTITPAAAFSISGFRFQVSAFPPIVHDNATCSQP